MRKLSALLLVLIITFALCACTTSFDDNPDAMNTASKSVLTVEVYDQQEALLATGSGFVVIDDSTVATNYHVVEGAYSIKVVDGAGTSSKVKHIIAYDQENDIALLKIISGKGYAPLSTNKKEIDKGEKVVAIGSPLGITNTFSTGIISGYIDIEGVEYIQFTAPISHGSSGGALFDKNGKVIGITSGSYEDGQNMNVAIPIARILDLYASKPSQPISIEDFYDLTKSETLSDDYTVGVRTISLEDKIFALVVVEKIKHATTEEEIIQIMDEYGASQGGGQLYEMYAGERGVWVEACEQWCYDPLRKAGDVAMLETEYGYTVMYCSWISK